MTPISPPPQLTFALNMANDRAEITSPMLHTAGGYFFCHACFMHVYTLVYTLQLACSLDPPTYTVSVRIRSIFRTYVCFVKPAAPNKLRTCDTNVQGQPNVVIYCVPGSIEVREKCW